MTKTTRAKNPLTLTVDIGGQGIKGMPILGTDTPTAPRFRIKTPRPATADPVIHTISAVFDHFRPFDRVTVGFPGVVNHGVVATAPNLDGRWKGVHLEERLGAIAGVPLRVINDADMQGFGAIEGKGVEMVITLGTGVGAALFLDGKLLPNLELGHHPFEKNETYEERLGQKALDQLGVRHWNRRIDRATKLLRKIFNFRKLYLGGGNSRCIDTKLPSDVVIVRNAVAFLGGARFWELG
ncbi:MAG: ROK family protein [Deltaproteobacteria bacterium]|nr:ROK family protein [Deltaproteobacteria bacterium]